MNRIKNWPAWLKGMLIPPLVVGILVLLAGFLMFIGFGAKMKVLAGIGMIVVYGLMILSSFIGGVFIEIFNLIFSTKLQHTEGGGTPNLLSMLVTLVFLVLLGGLIGWIYERRKKLKK